MDWKEEDDGDYFFALFVCLWNLAALLAAYFYPRSLSFLTFVGFVLTFPSFYLFDRDRREFGSPKWKSIPMVLRVLVVIACIHAFIGFFANASILGQGKFRKIDGVYYRWQQGQQFEITQEEYDRLQRADNRIFSGHALAFSSVPLAYFAGTLKEEREE